MRGFTLCSTFDCSKRDTPKAREVWYHRTNAIKGLQPRLVSPQLCADDASIQTVMTLVTIDVRNHLVIKNLDVDFIRPCLASFNTYLPIYQDFDVWCAYEGG